MSILDKEAVTPDWRALNLGWYLRIEQAYGRLGHTLGFNPVLVSSVESLAAKPRLMLATLNPAGNRDYPDHRGAERYESGNAYVDIDWDGLGAGNAPLQRQVQGAFRHMQRRVGDKSSLREFARTRVVTAQIVPFRSPDEKSLHQRDESLAFSRELWRDILKVWRPQSVVSIAGTTTRELSGLLGRVTAQRLLPTGWGKYTMMLREFAGDTRLLGLPHLSRFGLFGRPQSEPYLEEAFDWLLGDVL